MTNPAKKGRAETVDWNGISADLDAQGWAILS
jgi:hypothetical protein